VDPLRSQARRGRERRRSCGPPDAVWCPRGWLRPQDGRCSGPPRREPAMLVTSSPPCGGWERQQREQEAGRGRGDAASADAAGLTPRGEPSGSSRAIALRGGRLHHLLSLSCDVKPQALDRPTAIGWERESSSRPAHERCERGSLAAHVRTSPSVLSYTDAHDSRRGAQRSSSRAPVRAIRPTGLSNGRRLSPTERT